MNIFYKFLFISIFILSYNSISYSKTITNLADNINLTTNNYVTRNKTKYNNIWHGKETKFNLLWQEIEKKDVPLPLWTPNLTVDELASRFKQIGKLTIFLQTAGENIKVLKSKSL